MTLRSIVKGPARVPRKAADWLGKFWRGKNYEPPVSAMPDFDIPPLNDLERYFDSVHEGRGVWKWRHYLAAYERHFARFRNRPVTILEIGIYSGGSLEMWRRYFGSQCQIIGVDIEQSCMAYHNPPVVRVFVGNQGDHAFWVRFKREVGPLDIVIDDGSHEPEDQIITFEALWPHLKPGGVYWCEDIHARVNGFAAYLSGLMHALNHSPIVDNMEDSERRKTIQATPLQQQVESLTHYPFAVAIEKRLKPLKEFVAPKHGTQWQPFLR